MLNPELIKFFHEFFAWTTVSEKISTVFMIMTLSSVLIGLLLTPIIWNFYLIPKIEKRVGEKFELFPWMNFFLFDFWVCPQIDVSTIIIKKYVAFKRGKYFLNKPVPPGKMKMAWLATVNYDIREASKIEVFMAFFTLGMYVLGMLSLFCGVIVAKFF